MVNATAPTTHGKRDVLQSVQRACRILRQFAVEERPLTPRELSDALGLNLSTTYHLLNTLEAEGFVERDELRRLWLGSAIGELGQAFEARVAADPAFMRQLDRLNRDTGETSYLGVWNGEEVVSVALREGRGPVAVRGIHIGFRTHTYARALGRALLAYQGAQVIEAYLERTALESLTEYTTTDAEDLRMALARVRATGVAVEQEEFTLGVCCLAAPIFDPEGSAVAALSVSVPKARFDVDRASIQQAISDAARKAGEALAERSAPHGNSTGD